MNEDQVRKGLKEAYQSAEGKPPSFDSVWAAAEAAHGRSRNRLKVVGGFAAAVALIGITVSLWPEQQAELPDEFLIADALMNSTSWTAPSDSLMPEHQFDIYQDIPFLIESTKSPEGTLL
jgi:hypothetical protein